MEPLEPIIIPDPKGRDTSLQTLDEQIQTTLDVLQKKLDALQSRPMTVSSK